MCDEREVTPELLMNNEEPFLKMTLAEKVLDEKEDLQAYEKRITEERNKNWKEKALHGEYIKHAAEVMDGNSWRG